VSVGTLALHGGETEDQLLCQPGKFRSHTKKHFRTVRRTVHVIRFQNGDDDGLIGVKIDVDIFQSNISDPVPHLFGNADIQFFGRNI
jgi:hypothetical protein